MKRFEIKDHEPSLLPEGKWRLAWADEFDGTALDRTKWDFRLNYWGKQNPAYTDKGIVFDGKSCTAPNTTAIMFRRSFRPAQTRSIFQRLPL